MRAISRSARYSGPTRRRRAPIGAGQQGQFAHGPAVARIKPGIEVLYQPAKQAAAAVMAQHQFVLAMANKKSGATTGGGAGNRVAGLPESGLKHLARQARQAVFPQPADIRVLTDLDKAGRTAHRYGFRPSG